jgi:hypothetical protein
MAIITDTMQPGMLEREPKLVISNRGDRKQPLSFSKRPYKLW